MLNIFLDDCRHPEDVYGEEDERNWIICRNPFEFKDVLRNENLDKQELFVSFDHDLGEDENDKLTETGMDCAKWLVEQNIVPVDYNVHSANPVGAENIRVYIKNWIEFNRDA